MEFSNQHYYEITIKQRYRELLREAEAARLLKEAGLRPEKGIAWLMIWVNLTALWCVIRGHIPLVHKS
jgi:hypothetical protein